MLNLILNVGPAISCIFQLGFEPKEHDFYEFTEEQYEKLKKEKGRVSGRWYLLLPQNYQSQNGELLIVNEKEKENLLQSAQIIESYCKKNNKFFQCYEDKLTYVAKLLPRVFSEGTKFENHKVNN